MNTTTRTNRFTQLSLAAAGALSLVLTACNSDGQTSGDASDPLAPSEPSPLPSVEEAQADAETAISAENADDIFEQLKASIEQDLESMDSDG